MYQSKVHSNENQNLYFFQLGIHQRQGQILICLPIFLDETTAVAIRPRTVSVRCHLPSLQVTENDMHAHRKKVC